MNLSQKQFKFSEVRVGDFFMVDGYDYMKVKAMVVGKKPVAVGMNSGRVNSNIKGSTLCTESLLQR